MKQALGLALLALLLSGCAHGLDPAPQGARMSPPLWPAWGRKPGGAKVGYPDDAWSAGVEGDVVVDVCINERGDIFSIQPVSGPHKLASEVMRAIATWQYEPARPRGHDPEAVCFQRKFSFRQKPAPAEFFTTNADIIVTRDYEPPQLGYSPRPELGVKGRFFVRVCPGADGVPQDVTVLSGLGRDKNAELARKLTSWRYTPARLRGQPIAACEIVTLIY
ncbi:MAG TPA: TonB family protein [Polyangia bacterium]|nr:TonB family protein [Polyangia bacterium]